MSLNDTLRRIFALFVAVILLAAVADAQTAITPPANNFTVADDVSLGREAAGIISRQLPVVADSRIATYVNQLVGRLADGIPAGLKRQGFVYRVWVLNAKTPTIFSLPGGPMFLSRGLIGLAGDEDQLAAILAHEMSHVALRHATAQVTAGERYQIGEITGRGVAATLTSRVRGIFERATEFSARTYFLTYDQAHEQQADRLAIRLMAHAGYDSNALGVVIAGIVRQEGERYAGLRWTVSHPTPRYRDSELTRTEAIIREAAPGDIARSARVVDRLAAIHTLVAKIPAAREGQEAGTRLNIPRGTLGHHVPAPAGNARSVTAGDLLQLRVPADWSRLPAGNGVIFAPEGAFLRAPDGPVAVTHGIQVGIARSLGGNLERDMRALLGALAYNNPATTWVPAYQQVTAAGRRGITTTASNVSPVTGELERVSIWAAYLPGGELLYAIGVAPQEDAGTYGGVFDRALQSLQFVE